MYINEEKIYRVNAAYQLAQEQLESLCLGRYSEALFHQLVLNIEHLDPGDALNEIKDLENGSPSWRKEPSRLQEMYWAEEIYGKSIFLLRRIPSKIYAWSWNE